MFTAYMMFIDYPKYLVHCQVFHKILNKAHGSRIPLFHALVACNYDNVFIYKGYEHPHFIVHSTLKLLTLNNNNNNNNMNGVFSLIIVVTLTHHMYNI